MRSARRLSLRGALLAFVAMTGAVLAAAIGLLILLDPRAQDFWAQRFDELAAFLRGLLPR